MEGEREFTLHEKSDLFFHDYSLASLFVQENYINARPHATRYMYQCTIWRPFPHTPGILVKVVRPFMYYVEMVITMVVWSPFCHSFFRGNAVATLRCVAKAADSLCDGDLVEKNIRSSSNWGFLPLQVGIVYSEYLYCTTDGFLYNLIGVLLECYPRWAHERISRSARVPSVARTELKANKVWQEFAGNTETHKTSVSHQVCLPIKLYLPFKPCWWPCFYVLPWWWLFLLVMWSMLCAQCSVFLLVQYVMQQAGVWFGLPAPPQSKTHPTTHCKSKKLPWL